MSESHRTGEDYCACRRPFDESMLTGYMDQALTQEEEQRVRIHLEDCGACRKLVEELEIMRKAAMTSEFRVPPEDQWDERWAEQWNELRRGHGSGLAFGAGWLIVVVWGVGLASFALGDAWQGSQSLMEKFVIFGGVSGVALLFLSVLIDRLRSRQTDRYRRVKK